MKIVEFDDKGRRVEREADAVLSASVSALAPRPAFGAPAAEAPRERRRSSGIELHMFQTGTLRTKVKYIKMESGRRALEIPVPWFLLKHPRGNVVIHGGNAVEAAIDKRGHWGAVVDAYDPVMQVSENVVDQLKLVGVGTGDVRFVVQSHLHLDHTGAVGRFPTATTIAQRAEYEYAHKPHWFSVAACIRADFDRPGIDWKFLGGGPADRLGCVAAVHLHRVLHPFAPDGVG